MRCGEKCFTIHIDNNGVKEATLINARTPAEARKKFRKEFGKEKEIISVRGKGSVRL